ncbi:MAG: cob(I)yrinic acid a,c-diamide adenosyltransferase [Synergistaceae bacterium]|nr:cob(I)yrinic acid a,c-diamide adenosyltransferase [Synergistaceae bacterium]
MFGEKGLVHVYTGDGKGKTTSSLGLAMRASGQGAKVEIIQFMKGWDHYGELATVKLLPGVTLTQTGRADYVYRGKETREDYSEARRGLDLAKDVIASGRCDMLILDEINVALDYKLIPLDEVVSLVKSKPKDLELILTGRYARPEIIELADLVTEMREVRHPFQRGVTARKGVEY